MSIRIPAGARVLSGAPAQPMEPAIVEAIVRSVTNVSGIVEAHLPLCQIESVMLLPRIVLVIGLDDTGRMEDAVSTLCRSLSNDLPPDTHIDVWPFSLDDVVLQGIRKAHCRIM